MGKASGAVSLASAWNSCWEAWRFITMDRSCHTQLLAEAAGAPVQLEDASAAATREQIGTHLAGWSSVSRSRLASFARNLTC